MGHVYGPGTFWEVRALEGVSFAVEKGEVLGIVGKNGAGKTTLARIIAGLEELAEGSVAFLGPEHPRVGMVFQQPERQFFSETGLDELAYGLRVSPEEIPEDALLLSASLGLSPEELAHTSPFDLSPGKKRLLALLCFFVLDWDLLILDEPLTGLGQREARAASQALFSAKGERTLVVISHDLTHLFGYLSRIVLLDGGRLTWSGRPKDLLDPQGTSCGDLVELPDRVRLTRLIRGLFPEASLEAETNEEFARKILALLKTD